MRGNTGVILLLGALACAGSDTGPAGAAAEVSAASAAAPVDSARAERSRPIYLARLEERAPTTFPHTPHLSVDCTRCHAQIAGHARHANVACRQCHEAPAPTAVAAPAAAGASATECRSCHHASTQAFGCSHCHERGAPLPTPAVRIKLQIAGGLVTRTVTFPHARHADVACTTCHARADGAAAVAQCSSCHAQQHRASFDCSSCHSPPEEGVHGTTAHRGCGGDGCHENAEVLALPLTRPVCLVCHRAQLQHQPEEDCAACHGMRPQTATAGEAGQR